MSFATYPQLMTPGIGNPFRQVGPDPLTAIALQQLYQLQLVQLQQLHQIQQYVQQLQHWQQPQFGALLQPQFGGLGVLGSQFGGLGGQPWTGGIGSQFGGGVFGQQPGQIQQPQLLPVA
jgi:hypothetical protein